jgi:hypothetical protein
MLAGLEILPGFAKEEGLSDVQHPDLAEPDLHSVKHLEGLPARPTTTLMSTSAENARTTSLSLAEITRK